MADPTPQSLPTLAILAGGASTRMGRDKALLERDGVSLLARLAHLGRALTLPVLVIGRARPEPWKIEAVEFVLDEIPGQGPLGGVATALTRAPLVLAVACDMPAVDARALAWLVEQATTRTLVDGLVVTHAHGIEPLFSAYAACCLSAARTRLAQGQRALHHLIEDGDFLRVPAPEWLLPKLANINHPDDWQRLEKKL